MVHIWHRSLVGIYLAAEIGTWTNKPSCLSLCQTLLETNAFILKKLRVCHSRQYPINYLISINIYQYPFIYINIYIVGADDTVLCGRFSRGFLAHDMGFMYRFCVVFFTHDMRVMRRPNGQVFFHFLDR